MDANERRGDRLGYLEVLLSAMRTSPPRVFFTGSVSIRGNVERSLGGPASPCASC
jgi:hypothetical protein